MADLEDFLKKIDNVSNSINDLIEGKEDSISNADALLQELKPVSNVHQERTIINNHENVNVTPPTSQEAFLQMIEEDAKRREEMRRTNTIKAEEIKKKGNDAYKKGDFENAEIYYTEALGYRPDMLSLYNNRALMRLKMCRYQQACDDLKWALRLNEDNVKANFRMGQSLFYLDKFEESLDYLKRALKSSLAKERKQIEDFITIVEENSKAHKLEQLAFSESSILQEDDKIKISKCLKAMEVTRSEDDDVDGDNGFDLDGFYKDCNSTLQQMDAIYSTHDQNEEYLREITAWFRIEGGLLMIESCHDILHQLSSSDKDTISPQVVNVVKAMLNTLWIYTRQDIASCHYYAKRPTSISTFQTVSIKFPQLRLRALQVLENITKSSLCVKMMKEQDVEYVLKITEFIINTTSAPNILAVLNVIDNICSHDPMWVKTVNSLPQKLLNLLLDDICVAHPEIAISIGCVLVRLGPSKLMQHLTDKHSSSLTAIMVASISHEKSLTQQQLTVWTIGTILPQVVQKFMNLAELNEKLLINVSKKLSDPNFQSMTRSFLGELVINATDKLKEVLISSNLVEKIITEAKKAFPSMLGLLAKLVHYLPSSRNIALQHPSLVQVLASAIKEESQKDETNENILANASICLADIFLVTSTSIPENVKKILTQADIIQHLLTITTSTNKSVKTNAAICIARICQCDQACLQRLRDLGGTSILMHLKTTS